MRVLASFYHAHYLRVFVQINKKDKLGAGELLEKFGRVIYCKKCGFNAIFDRVGTSRLEYDGSCSRCPVCQQSLFIAGPIYLGALGTEKFLQQLLSEMSADTKLELT